ncbi:hypothetical protein U9M48_029052 [Paspalum notatum var. saurae]|uniref:Uncharacterized protein n=1 Tax=Paspalum notatum var. saurae TaxID=547442 RepID=A0AAQ3TXX2_PASNO
MQPGTTTTTEIWQWRCATCRADWKMLRQVTTCCPSPHGHACRCCQGTPPPARNLPPPPHHHHHHRQVEGASRALAAAEEPNAGRHVAAAGQVCWVPEPYLMVQQLREFESLNDEVVALRVQLQEYTEEIDRSSKRDNSAGVDSWFHALPPNVRDVLVLARDTIESFVAISTAAAANH